MWQRSTIQYILKVFQEQGQPPGDLDLVLQFSLVVILGFAFSVAMFVCLYPLGYFSIFVFSRLRCSSFFLYLFSHVPKKCKYIYPYASMQQYRVEFMHRPCPNVYPDWHLKECFFFLLLKNKFEILRSRTFTIIKSRVLDSNWLLYDYISASCAQLPVKFEFVNIGIVVEGTFSNIKER